MIQDPISLPSGTRSPAKSPSHDSQPSAELAADPRWSTQLRKGVLELAVLNVIAAGRLYGYEIAKRLAVLPEPAVKEGTVYPILSRLRSDGWVVTEWEESESGPPRKYYQLTDDGRRQLAAMNQAFDRLRASLETLRGS